MQRYISGVPGPIRVGTGTGSVAIEQVPVTSSVMQFFDW